MRFQLEVTLIVTVTCRESNLSGVAMKNTNRTDFIAICTRTFLIMTLTVMFVFVGNVQSSYAQSDDPLLDQKNAIGFESNLAKIFVYDFLVTGSDRGTISVGMVGDDTVPVGGFVAVTNVHSYPVIVYICTIDGSREYPYDIANPMETVYYPIDDDPRLAGTQFIVKVESANLRRSSLVVTIE